MGKENSDRLRKKCHMIEMAKGMLDDAPIDKVREMVGFYEPSTNKKGKWNGKWEVTEEYEGYGYTANTQFEAIVVAHQAEMRWLILKKLIKGGKNG